MNQNDDVINDLILQGGVEIYGIDIETGKFLYNFTDKMKNFDEDIKFLDKETLNSLIQIGEIVDES
jgi:hypothetical protein